MYKFISFEGIDGSGKTTLRNALLERLTRGKIPATSVGQNSWLSASAADTILMARERQVVFPAKKMVAAYLADKSLHYALNVLNLRRFGIVVSDRFYVSDIVYMHVLHGVPMEDLCEAFLSGPFVWPDYVFFVDVDPALAARRVGLRGKPRRHYEQEADLRALSEAYQRFFRQYADRIPTRLRRLTNDDGSVDMDIERVMDQAEIRSNPRCNQIEN